MRIRRAAFVLLLLSFTVLQRFGLRFGSYPLVASLLAIYFYLLVIAKYGLVVIPRVRFLLYCTCVIAAVASLYVNNFNPRDRSTLSSFFLLCVLYLPYTFAQRPGALAGDDVDWALRTYSNVALACACAGIVQFYAQPFVHADWLFDFSPYLPELLRGPAGFNTAYYAGWAYKSNGFFFLEPSHFSLYMGLALVVEITLQRRPLRLFCFGLALLLAYSGTGIVILCIGLLFPLNLRTVLRVLGLVLVGSFVLWAFGEALNLSFLVDRIDSFGSERTSAYERYVGPGRLIGDTIGREAWSFLLGHGPGSMSREIQPYSFHTPTWAKLIFEYGVLGFAAFVGLFCTVVCRRGMYPSVQAAIVVSWLVVDSHLLSPQNNYTALALAGLLTPSRQRKRNKVLEARAR